MSLSVRDESGNREQMITNAVNVIGRSKKKLMFFKIIYNGKKLVKPQDFIRNEGNFSSAKEVLTIGKKFVAERMVKQVKDDHNKTAYEKIDFYTHNKNVILSRVKKNSGIRFRYINPKSIFVPSNSSLRSPANSKGKKHVLKKWDVFISHASQDKNIAEPFVKKLKQMDVKVWYDKDVLRWGDSLVESINKGLKDSLYGVVILSKTFFKKHWTHTELRTLLSLANTTGEKKILPLFYKITHKEIVEEYPILADIFGRSWDEGIDNLAKEIKKLITEKRK
ncbi:MAG: toll/interleukin-1 receptor domain-containing protein [Nitrosotalea sp.]